jgi:hypothetical protein
MPNPTALTSSSPRRTRLVESLSSWFFNPHTLTSPDDLFFCACLLFEGVFSVDGMEEDLDGVQFRQFSVSFTIWHRVLILWDRTNTSLPSSTSINLQLC